MAVAWRASNVFTDPTQAGTGCTFTDPGVAGDLLIAIMESDDPANTWTAPDGTWTQLYNVHNAGSDNATVAIWYKKSGVGSGTYTFTSSTSTLQGGVLVAVSGANSTNPIDQSSSNPSTDAGDPWTLSATSITTVANNCLLLWFGAVSPTNNVGTDVFTFPGGYTSRVQMTDTSGWNGIGICSLALGAAGATGAGAGSDTRSGALAAATFAFHVSIAPANAATATLAWLRA